jgi:hypothetical protein
MRTADREPVSMTMAMTKQFLGRVPIIEFDAFQAPAIDPKVIGLFLNFSLGGFGSWFR